MSWMISHFLPENLMEPAYAPVSKKGDLPMGDNKKKEDPCVSMGKFEIKICEQKEKPPEKPKPPFDWRIVVTVAAAAGIGMQLSDVVSPGTGNAPIEVDTPTIASSEVDVSEADAPDSLGIPAVVPSSAEVSPTIVPEAPSSVGGAVELEDVSLNTLESVEQLPSALRQAIQTGNFEAIALSFSESEYWVGDVKSTLDLQTVAATDSLILKQMEEAIAVGCFSTLARPTLDTLNTTESVYWVCPSTAEPVSVSTLTRAKTALVNGETVNIRTQPTIESEVLTTLSYRILPLNQSALETFS
ncbi:MAG: hypothetical protein VKL39_11055, partial [Leptolyngbyaceae bacterium]|nr:hypothetical protein [Leptolyngbyaceae bacterium]